jgi:hypothetical protein
MQLLHKPSDTLQQTALAADGSSKRDQWCLDNWDAVAAHIGAAQRITHGAERVRWFV